MTDQTVVHIGENSPEEIALKLMQLIRAKEENVNSRKAILDLYAECLMAVRQPIDRIPEC